MTSRKLPGKLPGKLKGSKITGASRNSRRVYGDLTGDLGPVHTNPFSNENGAVLLRIRAIVHTTTPKTITENGAIRKRSPEWSDLKTMLFENAVFWWHDQAQDHSTVSIENGGQTLPYGFNFAPISRADILKCACVDFIWACALRV